MPSNVFESIAVKQLDVGTVQQQAGKVGRPAFFHAETNVKLGDYFNAAKSYMDFGTAGTGEVAGMASAFNSEIRLPNKTVTSGMYVAAEVNYNFQASTILQDTSDTLQVFAAYKAGGHQTGIDAWESQTYSGVFSFSGLTAGDGDLFATGTGGAMAASLRIFIDGTAYYIMLATTPSTT